MEQTEKREVTKEQMRKRALRKKKLRRRKRRMFLLECCVLFCLLGVIFVVHKNRVSDVPIEIAEFVEKYPEAKSFATNYNKYKDSTEAISIEKEMKTEGIPLFIQWDKRWGYKDYGGNYIGIAGCGPTCLSMVYCGLTGTDTYNPYEMARFSNEQGYYTYGEGTSWNLMTEGAETLGLYSENGSIDEAYILENLSKDTPIICSMKPGDFTYTGHFIVLSGIDENRKIIVNDPNSPKNSAQSWSAEDLVPQIKAIWRFEL
jgi:hypothetical protein